MQEDYLLRCYLNAILADCKVYSNLVGALCCLTNDVADFLAESSFIAVLDLVLSELGNIFHEEMTRCQYSWTEFVRMIAVN